MKLRRVFLKTGIPQIRILAPCLLAVASIQVFAGEPKYQKPDVTTPQNWQTPAPWHEASPLDSLPKGAWWTLFGDPELVPVRGQLTFLLPQPEVDYAVIPEGIYMFPRSDGILLAGDMHFFPQNQHFFWRRNSELDLCAGNVKDFDLNIAANQENLPGSSSNYKHAPTLAIGCWWE